MDFLLLIGGLAILIFAGELLVKGAVAVAFRFKISSLVVGMTVVSLGTSAPELIISIQAALTGHPDISIGNVVGSNIANLGLVLGITAIIFPIAINRNSIRIDWPMMMLASVLFYVLILDKQLVFYEGLLFVIILFVFLFWLVKRSRKKGLEKVAVEDEPQVKEQERKLWISITFLLVGSIGLVFGAKWLVEGATGIAKYFGVSERIIGLTIIAFGTSVPELVTSVIAAFRKQTDIAIGNLIGSNIFNILAILGITSMITPLTIHEKVLSSDVLWMLGIALALLPLMLIGKRLNAPKGALLLIVYVAYIFLLF